MQRAWGVTIRDGYGQTETTLQIGNTPGRVAQAGSMGWPLPGYEIGLLDPDGEEADEGEIAVSLQPRPISLMDGYLGDDGICRGVEGRWYRTGDTAMRNADGSFGLYRPLGRRLQIERIPDQPVRAGKRSDRTSRLWPKRRSFPLRTGPGRRCRRRSCSWHPDFCLTEPRQPASIAHLRSRLAPYKRVRRLEFGTCRKRSAARYAGSSYGGSRRRGGRMAFAPGRVPRRGRRRAVNERSKPPTEPRVERWLQGRQPGPQQLSCPRVRTSASLRCCRRCEVDV